MSSIVPSPSELSRNQRGDQSADESSTSAKSQIGDSVSAQSDSQPRHTPALRPPAFQVVRAGPGDHPAIHCFLVSVFQRPSTVEFHAQLEDPRYEPADRLLIKQGPQIVGHLRLLPRELRFGDQYLPVSIVTDVATLPQFRGCGSGIALLTEAQRQMQDDGSVMGILRTDQPGFYGQLGWVVCGRHSYSTASPRAILSHLHANQESSRSSVQDVLRTSRRCKYNIRLWRHVEEAALRRLYDENTSTAYGALKRDEAYWRWLINRGGSEKIYVAIDGPDKFELDDHLAPIVAYAAMKEGRIVEIMSSPEHPEAVAQLLARACGDAIEQDFHRVRIDAAPGHFLHADLVAAGGTRNYHEADHGLVFMVKLFDLPRFISQISDELLKRARDAALARPSELGLLLGNGKYRLLIGRRKVEMVSGKIGRSYIKCTAQDFTKLLLGHIETHEAIETGRLQASTRVAEQTAAVLFPRIPFWRPPWDELTAD
jgi:predicted N-acetyltransferase YhbS